MSNQTEERGSGMKVSEEARDNERDWNDDKCPEVEWAEEKEQC